ncbi:DUF1853 family protein [Undibacterium rugosum]|uniref:DUF1853 family protein n=1 Tax=Undibacterium rugosum TaxID=2762291 RepID=UPI001B845077|nr:DUF1853 family protein [Undibacterium rugosum]MBR7778035.1 DUF1853 family protein [Undibacterium rugosum]
MTAIQFQQAFHADWGDVADPDLRALIWLLTSPHLLSPEACWYGADVSAAFLSERDLLSDIRRIVDAPQTFKGLLAGPATRRLGLYAENLLHAYFQLVFPGSRRGLQIHDAQGRTIGEFDFLIPEGTRWTHCELATKFYLFHPATSDSDGQQPDVYDYLGPNLADSLGAKMHKIIHSQMRLGQQPQAVVKLGQAPDQVGALIKGWLFYREADSHCLLPLPGVAPDHCKGKIWTLQELRHQAAWEGCLLDRLEWLAPARVDAARSVCGVDVIEMISTQFALSDAPLMLAKLRRDAAGYAWEYERGFVVPDDWTERAATARILRFERDGRSSA